MSVRDDSSCHLQLALFALIASASHGSCSTRLKSIFVHSARMKLPPGANAGTCSARGQPQPVPCSRRGPRRVISFSPKSPLHTRFSWTASLQCSWAIHGHGPPRQGRICEISLSWSRRRQMKVVAPPFDSRRAVGPVKMTRGYSPACISTTTTIALAPSSRPAWTFRTGDHSLFISLLGLNAAP